MHAMWGIGVSLSYIVTVRPRDTRPQAARTLQVYVFELGPRLVRHLILLQTHKCSLLIMGLRIFEIKLC